MNNYEEIIITLLKEPDEDYDIEDIEDDKEHFISYLEDIYDDFN